MVVMMGCRLSSIEEIARAAMKKLTQRMAEHKEAMSTVKTEEEKAKIVSLLDSQHLYHLADPSCQLIWYDYETSAEDGAAENHQWIADLQ